MCAIFRSINTNALNDSKGNVRIEICPLQQEHYVRVKASSAMLSITTKKPKNYLL